MSKSLQFYVANPPHEVARHARRTLESMGRLRNVGHIAYLEAVLPYSPGRGRPLLHVSWHTARDHGTEGTVVMVWATDYPRGRSSRPLLEEFQEIFFSPKETVRRPAHWLWPVLLTVSLAFFLILSVALYAGGFSRFIP